MSLLAGVVGNNRFGVGDGSPVVARMGKTGEIIANDVHGEHYEAGGRGAIFTACTATAGIATATLAVTTACLHLLYNPIGSGVNLSLIQASAFYVSGTLGAGVLLYTTNSGVAVVTPSGTAIVARSSLLQGGNAAPKALAYASATTAANMSILRPFASLPAYAGAAIGASMIMKDQLNGEFVVPPGYFIGIHGITATGTSPVMGFSFSWEEVPV